MAGKEHGPKCRGCGSTTGLLFFPKFGLFLCEPCADQIARILRLCQGGLTEKELEFRLRVQGTREVEK